MVWLKIVILKILTVGLKFGYNKSIQYGLKSPKSVQRISHMNEQYYEKLFNIKTTGEQKEFNESYHYHIYEPTSYAALEALCSSYNFTQTDSIVDFGCGKGRFSFYINYFYECKITGIEMSSFFYKQAENNLKSYSIKNAAKAKKNRFINCLAEEYEVPPCTNKFYFFNPFSMQIFSKVVKNILLSKEESERRIDIILYYPSNDYILYLESTYQFQQIKEIRVPCLYNNDARHKFLIYNI